MKTETKKKIIYCRYILPPIFIALLPLIALIPSYRYVESGSARGAISLAALLSNAWEQGRVILFATPNATVPQTAYGRTLVVIIIIAAVLYLVALCTAVWSCIVALKLFMSDDEESAERSRTLFITFFPNRIVLTAVEALAIAITLFPYLMPLVYANTLGMKISMVLNAPDGLIAGIVFVVAIAILSVIAAPYERRFDADIFEKHTVICANGKDTDDEYSYVFSTDDGSDERSSELKEEQAELIRRLLNKDRGQND
ncbi:MAG: hypothetical protein J6L85_08070 [Clostridia bacterium]|nr:hypothetical protein [Clostridia bacterium]